MTKKVIIIDDSITQLNILKNAFIKANFGVWTFQNAKDGWKAIFEVAPDLIITDAIMPQMGGFQLIRAIRENEKISKIPLIVYSILNDTSAKYYIKEKMCEYFLRKNDNTSELVELAQKIVENYSVDDEYKAQILKAKSSLPKLENDKVEKNREIGENEINQQNEKPKEEDFSEDELNKKFKENYDFSFCDEKLISNLFLILYPKFKYDLAIISLYSFGKKKNTAFFDIKDILISPIFQKNILAKYEAKDSILYKKYSPELKTIVSEDEFLSKIEFVFENKDNTKIYCVFYSKEKLKWQNENNIEITKNLLDDFFKARFINKSSNSNQTKGIAKKYLIDNSDLSYSKKLKRSDLSNSYFVIVHINNFYDIEPNLNLEETDIFNSKITQGIMSCLDKDEEVYKNENDEYNVLMFAPDENKALYKLNCILKALEGIVVNNQKPDIIISAINCNIDGNIDIAQAKIRAKNNLETNTTEQKVIIQ